MSAEYRDDLGSCVAHNSERAKEQLLLLLGTGSDNLTAQEKKDHADSLIIATALFTLASKMDDLEIQARGINSQMPG